MIKVCYLMHGIYYGGATRSLHLLLKAIDNYQVEKYIVSISCRANEIKSQLSQYVKQIKIIKQNIILNNQIHYEDYISAMRKFDDDITQLIKFLLLNKINILHINTSVFPHLLRTIKEAIPDLKIVTHIRELIPKYDDGRLQEFFIRNISEYSEKIICISNNEFRYFQNNSNGIVIPNPFDFSSLYGLDPKLKSNYKISNDIVLIGMLSHFSEKKGHLEYLKTLYLLKNLSIKRKFKFVIIGMKKSQLIKKIVKNVIAKNNYEKKVIDFINTNSLKDHIILIPYTNRPLDYLADLDIVIRPSLEADPWGRDIIEAMALKKPIVATGTSEFFIENEKTGYLVSPRDPEQMLAKIIELINEPEKRKEFGEAGYRKIRQMCDLDEYGKKIFNIYSELLA